MITKDIKIIFGVFFYIQFIQILIYTLDELRLCTASFAESFLETPEENAPVKKSWTVFLVFLRVRRKSFDYSATPTTRLADIGFLYVLVLIHVSAA